MAKEIKMEPEDAINYVRKNVEVGDILEISYNRIYSPGEVLGITEEDPETGEGLTISLQLNGEMLTDVVDIDLKNIVDELIEMRHIHEDEEIVIEFY